MKTVRTGQATPTTKAMRGRIELQKRCVRKASKSSVYFAEVFGVRTRHRAALTILFLAIAMGLCAEELPRKAKTPRETYPGADVIYDSITTPDGKRLRTIVTKPRDAKGKVPVIFVAGWLSCDSVEAPAGTRDEVVWSFAVSPSSAIRLVSNGQAGCRRQRRRLRGNGFRIGVCRLPCGLSRIEELRFPGHQENLRARHQQRRRLCAARSGSDSEQAQVRGYISVGGWVKTWFEHMLEIERRRFALMGKSPGEVNDRMKGVATLYYEWLIKGRPVDDILKEQPKLADLWPEGKDHAHLYGRPLAFYQQLQQLNLAAAWSGVKVPTYVLRGAFDWIMSREDSELIAAFVNKNGRSRVFL